ncbi:glycosyltransferase family 9 protein [Leptospirillum sp. Group II 'CF-1']|uniref:glycosyltransferase family 9 protein n=1 Tax=Leptospirillum sp. Group II 'CF-1' TaxID=1660083 RepID=UPI00069E515B|nr:glycosyltransferase family 9 protein [Leptospirillum sp. Group II 'CF-1']
MNPKTLFQLYEEHTHYVSDKWTLYLTEYEKHLSHFRDKSVNLLEIGIQNGGSLEIWAKYFNNASLILGCDINPEVSSLSFEDPRIKVVIGDATDFETQKKIADQCSDFDIIIDDGSHHSSDIVQVFNLYFPLMKNGGLFIVEDLHCSYWDQFEGGLYHPASSISFFKKLSDVINQQHWGIDKETSLKNLFSEFPWPFNAEMLEQIHSVTFINSLCMISKQSPEDNRLGQRIIVGQVAQINSDVLNIDRKSSVSDQRSNTYSSMSPLQKMEQKYEHLESTLSDRNSQIASLESSLADRNSQIASLESSLADRNSQIASLESSLADRDSQIASLESSLADRNSQIASLESSLADRDSQIASLEKDFQSIISSRSWKLTSPLRRMASKHPIFAKQSFRLLKLFWWTLTLKLPILKQMKTYARRILQLLLPGEPGRSDRYALARKIYIRLPFPLKMKKYFRDSGKRLLARWDGRYLENNSYQGLARQYTMSREETYHLNGALSSNTKKRIQIFRRNGLGDVILATPVLRCLRKKFPTDHITFVTLSPEILFNNPNIDHIIHGEKPLDGYDLTIELDYEYFPDDHIVDAYARCAGVVVEDKNPEIYLDYNELVVAVDNLVSNGIDLNKPICAFQITSGWPVRDWPLPSFQKVAETLTSLGTQVIVLGEKATPPINFGFDFRGKTSIREAAAILMKCRAALTIDSSLMHVSLAVHTPVVSLFGCTNPEKRLPEYALNSSY